MLILLLCLTVGDSSCMITVPLPRAKTASDHLEEVGEGDEVPWYRFRHLGMFEKLSFYL